MKTHRGTGFACWFVALLIICTALSVDARLAAQGAPTGSVAGTLVERSSGRPVADGVVTIEGTALTATTNAVGRFRIERVQAGEVRLVVQALGFLELRTPPIQVAADATAQVRVELEPTPNYLEHVQVTATKTPLSIGDVPAQTSIVDRSTIERRGDQTLTQAIANVPGVIVSGQAGSFESVMLRGLPREGNEFTNTLLLIDGVPQVDSRNSARIIALPINDTSSIEVLRGPNSALYGRTAIGGSVNVRTADPTPVPQFSVDFTGGEWSMLKGLGAASGPIARWGGYYLSAEKERNHGFYRSPVSDFAIEKTAFFGKLTFVPDQKSFGSISANRVLSDDSTPTNVPVIDGRLLSDLEPRFDRLTTLNLPGPNYHQGETRVTLNYTRELAAAARVVEVFGYRRIQYKFLPDGDVIGSPFDLGAHTLTMYPFAQQTDEDIYYQEARVELTPKVGRVRNSIVAGASYERNTGATNGHLIFTDPDTEGWPLNYLNPVMPPESDWSFDPYGSSYHVGITGIFGQYIIEPASRWVLTAGGRYDRLALDNTRLGGARVDATFDAFSPKLSATYKVFGAERASKPTVNLYGAYSQAFLPPRRPSQLSPTNVAVNLKPEDISNYEAGLKASAAAGRLSVEATYFNMTRSGIVVQVRQGPFFIDSNAGEQKFKGVETGIGWTASPRLSAYVNASFYRARFGTFVIQSARGDTVLTGNRVPISPDVIVNSGLTFNPVPRVDVTLNVKRVGGVLVDQLNTLTLDPYALVDAAASWGWGPLRLTLSAHNLFNSEYYWGGDTSLAETIDPGHPRQILLTTSVRLR